jgi:MoxR-like ATPase
MQALIRGARIHCALDGRTAVSIDDVRRVALPALRHRVILNFQGEAESRDIDVLLQEVIDSVSSAVAV